MNLRHLARLGACSAQLVAVASLASASLAQSGTIRFIIGTGAGRRDRSLCPPRRRPMAKALGQTIIVEYKPGANGNVSAQFIADQPADGQYDLGRHPGLYRDQSQRVQQSALVDRRFHAVHPRRRGAAGVRRASRRPGQDLRGVPYLGQGQQAASSATRPTSPARRRIFSASSSTRSSTSISPTCPIAARACRRTRWSPAIRIRLRAAQHHGAACIRPASYGFSRSPGRSRHKLCPTCRPSPSSAIRSSPRGCGSGCWSRRARRRNRQALHRSRQGCACRSRVRDKARSTRLRCRGRNRAAASAQYQGADRALGELVKASGFSAEDRGSTR